MSAIQLFVILLGVGIIGYIIWLFFIKGAIYYLAILHQGGLIPWLKGKKAEKISQAEVKSERVARKAQGALMAERGLSYPDTLPTRNPYLKCHIKETRYDLGLELIEEERSFTTQWEKENIKEKIDLLRLESAKHEVRLFEDNKITLCGLVISVRSYHGRYFESYSMKVECVRNSFGEVQFDWDDPVMYNLLMHVIKIMEEKLEIGIQDKEQMRNLSKDQFRSWAIKHVEDTECKGDTNAHTSLL
jgi:hypothetical protein